MGSRTRTREAPRRAKGDELPEELDAQSDSAFVHLAKKLGLTTSRKSAIVKVKPDVLKSEIWDVLEKEDFAFRLLLKLENLQILEGYDCCYHI